MSVNNEVKELANILKQSYDKITKAAEEASRKIADDIKKAGLK